MWKTGHPQETEAGWIASNKNRRQCQNRKSHHDWAQNRFCQIWRKKSKCKQLLILLIFKGIGKFSRPFFLEKFPIPLQVLKLLAFLILVENVISAPICAILKTRCIPLRSSKFRRSVAFFCGCLPADAPCTPAENGSRTGGPPGWPGRAGPQCGFRPLRVWGCGREGTRRGLKPVGLRPKKSAEIAKVTKIAPKNDFC